MILTLESELINAQHIIIQVNLLIQYMIQRLILFINDKNVI